MICRASCRFSPNEFNKFNNTGARTQEYIYRMTLKSHSLTNFALKRHEFDIRKRCVLRMSTHNVSTQFAYLFHQWIIVFNACLY